jgi:plasmid stabilization system protein ParE
VTYRVRLTRQAQADLQRLFDFIIERELASHTGELEIADRALTAIRAGFETLQSLPFTCRKAGDSPFLRELVISFGATGYIALFEILDEQEVVIAAVRHQHEDDYY